MDGWTKVDPKAHARAMKIIAEGRKNGESSRDLIDRANAEVGIFPKRRRVKNAQWESLGGEIFDLMRK